MPPGYLFREIFQLRHWPKAQATESLVTCRHVESLECLSQTSVDTRQATDRGRRKPSYLLWYKNTKFHALKRTCSSSLLDNLGKASMEKHTWNWDKGAKGASPVTELRAWLWHWRGIAVWGGRPWGRAWVDALHRASWRRYGRGWVPHVGTVWCRQQLRRRATEVLDRGRGIDSCGLAVPWRLPPGTGPLGVQVVQRLPSETWKKSQE